MSEYIGTVAQGRYWCTSSWKNNSGAELHSRVLSYETLVVKLANVTSGKTAAKAESCLASTVRQEN